MSTRLFAHLLVVAAVGSFLLGMFLKHREQPEMPGRQIAVEKLGTNPLAADGVTDDTAALQEFLRSLQRGEPLCGSDDPEKPYKADKPWQHPGGWCDLPESKQ